MDVVSLQLLGAGGPGGTFNALSTSSFFSGSGLQEGLPRPVRPAGRVGALCVRNASDRERSVRERPRTFCECRNCSPLDFVNETYVLEDEMFITLGCVGGD